MSARQTLEGSGVTTDATPKDIMKIAVSEGETVLLDVTVIGREHDDASAERASFKRRALAYRNIGGNVTLQGEVEDGAGQSVTHSAFLAVNSAADVDVTGDGTEVTVEFNVEHFDLNGDFDASTDTFTAPITGKYWLSATVQLTDVGAGGATHDRVAVQLKTTARPYVVAQVNGLGVAEPNAADTLTLGNSFLVDMAAGDTAFVTVFVSGGTKIVDIAANSTFFSGFLVAPLHTIETTETMDATLAVDTTAQTVDVNVTGKAATTIEWDVFADVKRITPKEYAA